MSFYYHFSGRHGSQRSTSEHRNFVLRGTSTATSALGCRSNATCAVRKGHLPKKTWRLSKTSLLSKGGISDKNQLAIETPNQQNKITLRRQFSQIYHTTSTPHSFLDFLLRSVQGRTLRATRAPKVSTASKIQRRFGFL